MQDMPGPLTRPLPIAVPPQPEQPLILVLEDQEEVRSLLRAMLKIRGFTCDTAATLAEARALVRQHAYDVLFLDVNLPDGSGLTLAEESASSPLVIVITGEERYPDRGQGHSRRGHRLHYEALFGGGFPPPSRHCDGGMEEPLEHAVLRSYPGEPRRRQGA